MHYLFGLVIHLHLFLGVVVVGEDIDLGNEIVGQLMGETLGPGGAAGGKLGILLHKLVHCRGSGSGSGLIGGDMHRAYRRQVSYGFERHHHLYGSAVRIGYDAARSVESIVAVHFGHHQRHVDIHAESARIVNHRGSRGRNPAGIGTRHRCSGRHENKVQSGKIALRRQLFYHRRPAAEFHRLACRAFRPEESQSVYRKVCVVKHLEQFLPHSAACSDNCYVHFCFSFLKCD